VVGGNRQKKMMKLGWMLLRIWNHKNSVRTPYSATREARLRDRGIPYNWGGTAYRRPHTSFLCGDFFFCFGGIWWNL